VVEEEEEEEMEEVRLDELLVGLPEGTNPRFAMAMVPPGISSGLARTSKVRARDSSPSFLKIRGTPSVWTSHPRDGRYNSQEMFPDFSNRKREEP